LRYGRQSQKLPAHLLQFSADKKPVVVWNCTRRCNLHCAHCYAAAEDREYPDELTHAEARALIDDLAAFGVPVLLFSGGEPLLREDVLELASLARKKGIRPVLSTNGTLISPEMAQRIKDAGVGYVGISIDGVEEHHDRFRGHKGAFAAAMQGVANCVAVGQRVGLRFTVNRRNYQDVGAMFDLIERENIDRACFYHLVYSGRGSAIRQDALTSEQTREVVDLILERAADFHRRELNKDILTVDNHTDGVYLYQRVRREQPERAEQVRQLLLWNGGNSTGSGIADIDNVGNVHPDQFWWHYTLGNVRERPFSQIWADDSEPLLRGLRNRKPLLKGRCGQCRYLDICNGNFRVRAEAVHGDVWAPDPACYLTDAEIGLT